MDNLYNLIEDAARKSGFKNITEFCKDAGIPRATMSELKAGRTKRLSAKTASSVSNKLQIPLSVLPEIEEYTPMIYCEECGFSFNKDDGASVSEHAVRHAKWKRAEEKFGFCWNYQDREERKAAARQIVGDTSKSLSDKIDAEIVVLKALFSRSVQNSDYDLDHVDFQTYVSMMLNQGDGAHGIPSDVYSANVSLATVYRALTGKTEPTAQLVQQIAAAVQYKPPAHDVSPGSFTQEGYTQYLQETLTQQREDNERRVKSLHAHYNRLLNQDRRTIRMLSLILALLVAAFIIWLIIDVTHPTAGWFQREIAYQHDGLLGITDWLEENLWSV